MVGCMKVFPSFHEYIADVVRMPDSGLYVVTLVNNDEMVCFLLVKKLK